MTEELSLCWGNSFDMGQISGLRLSLDSSPPISCIRTKRFNPWIFSCTSRRLRIASEQQILGPLSVTADQFTSSEILSQGSSCSNILLQYFLKRKVVIHHCHAQFLIEIVMNRKPWKKKRFVNDREEHLWQCVGDPFKVRWLFHAEVCSFEEKTHPLSKSHL